jgi:hypothetical protein
MYIVSSSNESTAEADEKYALDSRQQERQPDWRASCRKSKINRPEYQFVYLQEKLGPNVPRNSKLF